MWYDTVVHAMGRRKSLLGRIVPACWMIAVACGSRTDPRDLLMPTETGASGEVSAGGVPVLGSGGARASAGGGRVATGGRTASSGGVTGTGGRLPGAGGQPVVTRGTGGVVAAGGATTGTGGATTETARLLAFICRDSCDTSRVCPSAAPYAGGCNQVAQRCIITCEKGCPPGTQTAMAAGGCFCYVPDVDIVGLHGKCCAEQYCGPPYNLPCCYGTCSANGTCPQPPPSP